jgi:hypothetical protein
LNAGLVRVPAGKLLMTCGRKLKLGGRARHERQRHRTGNVAREVRQAHTVGKAGVYVVYEMATVDTDPDDAVARLVVVRTRLDVRDERNYGLSRH